jgi:putative SOS response-associated peptidase YedK
MCTNYVTTVRDEIRTRLNLEPPTFDYEPELWPGFKGPILVGGLEWRLAMFGLVPYFSKDGKDYRRTYNARAETVDSRPTYRGPWARRQLALVPMSCFFEPDYETGRAVRWRIARRDGEPFTVAALWDRWRRPDGEILHSFSMLTINADGHPVMGRFHRPGDEKRSLVVVPAEHRRDWLEADDPRELLREMPPDEFTSAPDPLPPKAAAAKPAVARPKQGQLDFDAGVP